MHAHVHERESSSWGKKKHILASIYSSGMKHQWVRNEIVQFQSYLHTKYLLTTKRIKSDFIVEKPAA